MHVPHYTYCALHLHLSLCQWIRSLGHLVITIILGDFLKWTKLNSTIRQNIFYKEFTQTDMTHQNYSRLQTCTPWRLTKSLKWITEHLQEREENWTSFDRNLGLNHTQHMRGTWLKVAAWLKKQFSGWFGIDLHTQLTHKERQEKKDETSRYALCAKGRGIIEKFVSHVSRVKPPFSSRL